ncbi:uncharacterized protein LOC127739284 isoform X2 [Mytilus californianus]|uniref:uncharacterized protein LOC127739284 isoform X2 n=1 Tax=Mytilus californianus TaxID=6549 RepID=UPI0022463830|nr:uncharacterized protein LOC127739284 isoform X2 [Mytilus californianus]
MGSLSVEEENYVRMSLLLTGISPRAARTFFDSEFAPACLDATIKKEYNKLLDLKKKHRINQSQWNHLFPRFPGVPDSKSFDVTLMTTLLRNLIPLNPPLCGFDCLPTIMETTQAADLARIKHYRIFLAHLEDGKIDTSVFNTAWTDITGAIDRLGGQQMKQECDQLKAKPLDQTNQEIMIDIKRLMKSVRNLKRSHIDMRKSHDLLQENHKKVKKSHELLQDDHRKVTKEMEIMKTSQQDTVPWNTRARNEETLINWKDNDDKMFITTRAAKHILKCIQENCCVTITASSGVGKTATLRHVALQMVNEEYDVLMVTDPGDIVNYNNPNKKTLFVFDDLCGNFSVEQSDIKSWDPVMENIKILDKKQTKILAACRLQVYRDEKFESLSIFKSCVCNLLSENMCLSKTEKQSIADLYLKTKAAEITDYCNLYDCFPLLCKLYHDSPKLDIKDFFQNPFSVYEAEIINLRRKGHHTEYCALALCVMFNNKLREEIFTAEVNEATKIIIENTCEACRLDRGTSRLVLHDGLESLKDTFIKQEQNIYKILHDKLFDFLVYCFGQKIILHLIKNADSGLIKERFLLKRKDDIDQFITVIPTKYHQIFIQRIIDDWSKGKVQDVFSNINMKIPQFRQKFLCHLNTLDISYQRQLAHICDKHKPLKKPLNSYSFLSDAEDDTYDTALLQCCYIGDISLVQWCCNQDVDVKICTHSELSPVMIACKHGHTEIAKMLLDRGADCNNCDMWGQSPVMIACEHGHTEIVKILLERGVDYDKCNWVGQSPVMKACEHGHTEIVKGLLDRGVDYNKCDKYGHSPVMMVCEHGHTEIVQMLLDKGVDYNKCDLFRETPAWKACEHGHTEILMMLLDRGVDYDRYNWVGQSSVMIACKDGHTEIVKVLLDRGADYNKCDQFGQSLLVQACDHGHTEIVKMLLDKGVDCNKCDNDSQSPVMKACENGHTEIVKMLLLRGTDCNKCDGRDQSPVMKACQHGHIEIVKMLLDKGADCNDCDNDGRSPLMKACEHGHTEIVKMLLDKGVDCNKCDNDSQSPVMKACENGHTEIVKMLLLRGADCNKCDGRDQSPVMKACQHGHIEIVKMLLDKGADCNDCDNDGRSPLMKACEHGHTEIVKVMLDKWSDCNKSDNDGRSPVMKACEDGHKEIVKMMLVRGADCNKCDNDGRSLVMKACEHGHTEIVKMLLDEGADCNKCDNDGRSPVSKACEYDHTEIVKMLIDKGADCNKCDKDGQSPVMKICEDGHTDIVKMLLDRGADCNKCDRRVSHLK